MANEQINQYAVTATAFFPGSFMDIDQLIAPGVWESQKIDFSAMFTQFGNIYNYDGTITEQRTLDGDSKTKGLFFIELQTFTVRATALEFESDINITLITDPVGALIIPSDTDPAANVVTPLEFMVKGDTTANHILTYVNGAWETVALTSDLISIYNADGVITGPRTIDANGNPLTFDNISNFYLENVGQVAFNDTANISFLIQLGGLTSFNFGASSAFNANLNIGTDVFASATLESVMLTQGRGITVPSLTTVKEAALPIIVNRESLFLHNSDLNRFRGYDGAVYQSFAYLSDIPAGIIDGSGTAGTIPIFTDSDTIADSTLKKIGLGGETLTWLVAGAQFLIDTGSETFNLSPANGTLSHNATFLSRLRIDEGVAITANRTWDMPNSDGTIALLTDTALNLPLAGGTMSGTIIGPAAIENFQVPIGGWITLDGATGAAGLWSQSATTTILYNDAVGAVVRLAAQDAGGKFEMYVGGTSRFEVDTNRATLTNGIDFRFENGVGTGDLISLSTTTARTWNLPDRDVDVASTSGVQESTTVTSSTGAGAVGITGGRHEINMTAIGNALTLANGSIGQRLNVVCVSELLGPDTAILTPTTLLGSTSITFGGVGDCVSLEYGTGGWAVISAQGATCA